jgi:hypothetical protein
MSDLTAVTIYTNVKEGKVIPLQACGAQRVLGG